MPSLGNDLAALRKKLDLSLEDVKQSTKIPIHILLSIEDNSIFKQINTNTTYTRSYVRSYAKSIGIEEAKIVEALDQVENGNYDGSLAPDQKTAASKAPQDKDQKNSAEGEKATETEESTEAKEPNESHETTAKEKKPDSQEQSASQAQNKTSKKTVYQPSDETKIDLDWVRVGYRTKTKPSRSPYWTGLLVIILLVAIIASGYLLYIYYYEETTQTQPSENVEEPATPSDSLRQALLNREESSRSALANDASPDAGALPDTLSIAIYAANGNLNPVRVYTDILGRRDPFWVNQGDTLHLAFVDTIRIRAVDQYDRLQLLVNGHIIQNFYQQYYNPETEMVELSRTVFKNHPEWHRPVEQNPVP